MNKLLIIVSIFLSVSALGQSTIRFQDFEEGSDDWAYSSFPAAGSFTESGDEWNIVSSLGTLTDMPTSGSSFFGGTDIDNPDNSTTGRTGELLFGLVSVLGYTSVTISFDYEVDGFDSPDDIQYVLTLDNVQQSAVTLVDGQVGGFSTSGTETINIPDGSTNVSLYIIIDQNGDDFVGLDNFKVSGFAPGSPSVAFDAETSAANETNGIASISIPVSLANYGGTEVDLDVTVTGGSAESSDYVLTTTFLSFNSSTTKNILLDINDDSDVDDETIELLLTETSSTGINISSSIHTITINDDETLSLTLNEIFADPGVNGDANNDQINNTSEDEFVEIVNTSTGSVDISNWILADALSDRHVFPNPTVLEPDQAIVVFSGGNPSGSFSGAHVQVASTGDLSLNNTSENVILKTDNDVEIFNVSYGSEADDDQSITLDADLVGSFTKHSIAAGSGGELFSPGTKIDGTPFVSSNTITWDGSEGDEDWSNPANWSGNAVPSSIDNVIIASSSTDPVLGFSDIQDYAVNDLTINTGASLFISSGSSLAIFGVATNNGTYEIERNTTGNAGYSIVGSPVEGAIVSDLSADYIYEFDGTSYSAPEASDELTVGKGFFVGYDAASPTITLSGTPASGSITRSVTSGNFELLANPYSAQISVTKFISTNFIQLANVSVYLWDDGGENVGSNRGGDYVVYSGFFGELVNSDTDGTAGLKGVSGISEKFIPSMQGFYIEASETTDITFNPVMQSKVSNGNSDENYYRQSNKEVIRIGLKGGDHYNEILIGLAEEADRGKDKYDATKLSGNELISFYSMINDDRYAIQALPSEIGETKVQLGFDLAEAGSYELKIQELIDVSESRNIFLYDKLTDQYYDLKKTESISFSTLPIENDKRFELQFSVNDVLSVEDSSEKLTIFGNASELTILSGLTGKQEVTIYSMDGKVAFAENVSFAGNRVTIDTNLKENELYVLRVGKQSFKFVIQ